MQPSGSGKEDGVAPSRQMPGQAVAIGAKPSRRAPGRAVVICAAVVVVSGAVALVSLQPSTSCEMADRYLRTMAHQWPGALAEARGTNPAAFACGGTLAAATTSHEPAFGTGPADPAQRRN